jgi:PAS domain-containing protein
VHRSPRLSGLDYSRWSLARLRNAFPWLAPLTLPGVAGVLDRLQISYRRGREYLHSPDPDYDRKMEAVREAREASARPEKAVLLYQDEMSYYRRPSLCYGYGTRGADEVRADLGYGSNTRRRLLGALDARTGELLVWQRSRSSVGVLLRYYEALERAWPDAEVIYLAQDNWPVHANPRLLEFFARPERRLVRLPLPTYAPWTNPIEKAWRKLKQEVIHHHEFAHDWQGLQGAVQRWLDRHRQPNPDLLRYVGLQCPG